MKMKVITKIVMNITTGEILEEESYEYLGPVAECKGGGSSSTTTVDYEYNRRMADISEQNQAWAEEMYNMFKYGVTYNPESDSGQQYATGKKIPNPEWERWNEKQSSKRWVEDVDPRGGTSSGGHWEYGDGEKNIGPEPEKMIDEMSSKTKGEVEGYDPDTPTEMGNMMERIRMEAELMPDIQESRKKQLGVLSSLYDDAMTGIDVEERVGQARTGVMQDFTKVEEITKRNMSRMGVDPTSGAAAETFRTGGIQKSLALAGASTEARRQAEDESFERKRAVAGIGV
jgi:hypothetical protein